MIKRNKLGQFVKGNSFWKGKKHPHSKNWRNKVSETNTGHEVSKATRKKIKEGLKTAYREGRRKNWKDGVKKMKGYQSFITRRRRYRKKQNGGSHTFGEWELLKAQYNYTCPCCEKSEPEIILTEDHIIPVSRGGSDNIENIQPLCKSCNSKKHTKIITY